MMLPFDFDVTYQIHDVQRDTGVKKKTGRPTTML